MQQFYHSIHYMRALCQHSVNINSNWIELFMYEEEKNVRVLRFNMLGCLLEINQKETMNFVMTYSFPPEDRFKWKRANVAYFTISELSSWNSVCLHSSFPLLSQPDCWETRSLTSKCWQRVSLIRRWFLKAAYICYFWKLQSSIQPPLQTLEHNISQSEQSLACHIVSTVIQSLVDGFTAQSCGLCPLNTVKPLSVHSS